MIFLSLLSDIFSYRFIMLLGSYFRYKEKVSFLQNQLNSGQQAIEPYQVSVSLLFNGSFFSKSISKITIKKSWI